MKNLLVMDTAGPVRYNAHVRTVTCDSTYKSHRILLNGYVDFAYVIQSMKKNL